jgi:hypothetical protein
MGCHFCGVRGLSLELLWLLLLLSAAAAAACFPLQLGGHPPIRHVAIAFLLENLMGKYDSTHRLQTASTSP